MTRPVEILLVEDSSSDRYLAMEALTESKILHKVQAVDDGIEALDFVHRAGRYSQVPRPDLILLDLNLPRKDGREVLAELKADPDLRRIPVVILAGSGDAVAGGLRPYPQHAQSYISKPIDNKQFNEVIRLVQDLWFPDPASEVSPISPKVDGGVSPNASSAQLPGS